MNPIQPKISGVFIPVSDIEKARDWYCDLLNLPTDGEIYFGHIYVIPMGETDIILDSSIYHPDHAYKIHAFQLRTNDIHQAFEYMQARNVELTSGIENNHWFTFKDPDGNLLMVCQ